MSFYKRFEVIRFYENKKEVRIRAVLDTSSQRTNISQRVLNVLNLKEINKERISINTFDSKKSTAGIVDIMQFQLKKIWEMKK